MMPFAVLLAQPSHAGRAGTAAILPAAPGGLPAHARLLRALAAAADQPEGASNAGPGVGVASPAFVAVLARAATAIANPPAGLIAELPLPSIAPAEPPGSSMPASAGLATSRHAAPPQRTTGSLPPQPAEPAAVQPTAPTAPIALPQPAAAGPIRLAVPPAPPADNRRLAVAALPAPLPPMPPAAPPQADAPPPADDRNVTAATSPEPLPPAPMPPSAAASPDQMPASPLPPAAPAPRADPPQRLAGPTSPTASPLQVVAVPPAAVADVPIASARPVPTASGRATRDAVATSRPATAVALPADAAPATRATQAAAVLVSAHDPAQPAGPTPSAGPATVAIGHPLADPPATPPAQSTAAPSASPPSRPAAVAVAPVSAGVALATLGPDPISLPVPSAGIAPSRSPAAPRVDPAPAADSTPPPATTAPAEPRPAGVPAAPEAPVPDATAATPIASHAALALSPAVDPIVAAPTGDAAGAPTPVAAPAVPLQPATAEPAHAPPAAPVALPPQVETIAAAARLVAFGTTRRLTVSLSPRELGTVEIEVARQPSGAASVSLSVERPATLALLRGDAPALQSALDRAGVPVADRHLTMTLATDPAPSATSAAATSLAFAGGGFGAGGFGEGRAPPSRTAGPQGDVAQPADPSAGLPAFAASPIRATARAGIDITA